MLRKLKTGLVTLLRKVCVLYSLPTLVPLLLLMPAGSRLELALAGEAETFVEPVANS